MSFCFQRATDYEDDYKHSRLQTRWNLLPGYYFGLLFYLEIFEFVVKFRNKFFCRFWGQTFSDYKN